MAYKLGDVILSRETIARRVKELAEEITNNNGRENNLTVVGILTGASFFLTDLVREMPEDMDVRIDFMSVASYGDSTKSSGVVRIFHDLKTSIEGKNVLVVEDIVDSGLTLSHLLGLLEGRNPASLKVCCLLDKYERSKTFIGDNKARQSFSVRLIKLFPKYGDEAEYELFQKLNEAVHDLAEMNLITCKCKNNEVIDSVSLDLSRLDDIYVFLSSSSLFHWHPLLKRH